MVKKGNKKDGNAKVVNASLTAEKKNIPKSESGYKAATCHRCNESFLPSGVGSFGARIVNDDGSKTWRYTCQKCRTELETERKEKAQAKRELVASEKAVKAPETINEKAERIGAKPHKRSKSGPTGVKLESTKALEAALKKKGVPEPPEIEQVEQPVPETETEIVQITQQS